MNRKMFLSGFVFLIALLTNMTFVSARTLEVNLVVKGLNPIQDVEFYYGYPIYYTIFTNYSVELDSLAIVDYGEVVGETNGNFVAKLVSRRNRILYETRFEPSFLILSNTTIETDFDIVTLDFPILLNARTLKIYYNNEEKLSVNLLSELCDNNRVCEGNENYYSCPNDCEWFSEDGLCLGAGDVFDLSLSYWEDNYCDLDCYEDDDCNEENCNDNIRNQDEEGVDCGGVCFDECSRVLTGKAISNLKKGKNILVIILIIIILLIFYLVSKRLKKCDISVS